MNLIIVNLSYLRFRIFIAFIVVFILIFRKIINNYLSFYTFHWIILHFFNMSFFIFYCIRSLCCFCCIVFFLGINHFLKYVIYLLFSFTSFNFTFSFYLFLFSFFTHLWLSWISLGMSWLGFVYIFKWKMTTLFLINQ